MFQCISGSSNVCLTTFLLEAAAAASVETLFRKKNPIAGFLGQATWGCLAGIATVMGCSSGRRCTVLVYRRILAQVLYLSGASLTHENHLKNFGFAIVIVLSRQPIR